MLFALLAAVAAGGQAAADDETNLLIPEAAATGAPANAAPGAAATAADATGTLRAPTVGAWDFIRMLIVLAAVVAVIYLVFWLLRRSARGRQADSALIKVLGSRGLAGSRALHLVEVGRSVYLVGACDGGVELIAEVTDPESLDAIRAAAVVEGPRRRTFAEVLGEVFRPASRKSTLGDGVDFLRRSRDRLSKLRGGR